MSRTCEHRAAHGAKGLCYPCWREDSLAAEAPRRPGIVFPPPPPVAGSPRVPPGERTRVDLGARLLHLVGDPAPWPLAFLCGATEGPFTSERNYVRGTIMEGSEVCGHCTERVPAVGGLPASYVRSVAEARAERGARATVPLGTVGPGASPVLPGDAPIFGARYWDPAAGFYVLTMPRFPAVPGGVSVDYRDGAIRVECSEADWCRKAVEGGHLLCEVTVREAPAGAPDELEAMLELFREEWAQLPAQLAAAGVATCSWDRCDELVKTIVARAELLSVAHIQHVVRVLTGA